MKRIALLVGGLLLVAGYSVAAKTEDTKRFSTRGCPRGRDGVRGLQCGASTLFEFLQSNGRGLPSSDAPSLCDQLTSAEKTTDGGKYWCVNGTTLAADNSVTLSRTDAGMATATIPVCAGSLNCREYTGVRNTALPEDGGASLWHSAPVVATGTVSTPYTACVFALGGGNARASQSSTQTAMSYGNAAYYTTDGGTDLRFRIGMSSGHYFNSRNSLTSCATPSNSVNATAYRIPTGQPYFGCARFDGTQTSYWIDGTTAAQSTTSAQCAGGPAAVFTYGGSDSNPGAASPGIGGWAFGWLLGGFYTEAYLSDSRLAELRGVMLPYSSVRTAKGAAISNTRATTGTCSLSDGGVFFVPAGATCIAEGAMELARASTNYVTQSEQMDSWSSSTAGGASGAAVLANTATAPWGPVVADRLTIPSVTSSQASGVEISAGCPANQNVVYSGWIQGAGASGSMHFRVASGAGAYICKRCDFVDGVPTRCSGYGAVTDGGAFFVGSEGRASACGSDAGVFGAQTVHVTGMQCEIDDGTHQPSAYVPTYGATASRAADAVSFAAQQKPTAPLSVSVRYAGPMTRQGEIFEVSRAAAGVVQTTLDGGAVGGISLLGATVEWVPGGDGGVTQAVDQTDAMGWLPAWGYTTAAGASVLSVDTETAPAASADLAPGQFSGVSIGAGYSGKLKAVCIDTKVSKCR